MKRAKVWNILAALLLITVAAGCRKTPKNITNIPGQNRPDLQAAGPGGMETGPGPGAAGLGLGGDRTSPAIPQFEPLENPSEIAQPIEGGVEDRAALAPQTIYFDFDRSAIQPSEQEKLAEVAAFMQENPAAQLKIEGYCDERGTEGYNLSLGERRAIAAREFLIQKHGIDPARITTVSFGEERPADPGNTEEAYALNRRAEFVVLRPS